MARLRQRARLPLVAVPAGGLVGVLGSYLYWTVSPVRVEGVPLTGRLADFGIGGVRTWSLLLALAVMAYGALVLRARSRNATQGEALARLGIGLAVLPGDLGASPWCMFLDVEVARLGPGPWVTMAGGLVAWLGARGLLSAPSPPRRPSPGRGGRCWSTWPWWWWPSWSRSGCSCSASRSTTPGEFLGFFIALTALAATLSTLGVFKGLAGPFAPQRGRSPSPCWRCSCCCSRSPRRATPSGSR